MPTHKFQIGQTAFLNPSNRHIPEGACVVTKKLPERSADHPKAWMKKPRSWCDVLQQRWSQRKRVYNISNPDYRQSLSQSRRIAANIAKLLGA